MASGFSRKKLQASGSSHEPGRWLPALAGSHRQGWHLRIFGGKIPTNPAETEGSVWAYRANQLATRISNPSAFLPTRGFSSISPHTAKRWTRCSRGSTVGKASWSSPVQWAPASRHCAPPVLHALNQTTFSAFVPDACNSREELLKTLLVDFGIISADSLRSGPLRDASRTQLRYALDNFLRSLEPLRAFAVVVIDEAHKLSIELLHEIHLMSVLQRRHKLLVFVLVGQPGLKWRLGMPEMRQLAQRVSIWSELRPLARKDLRPYVSHRLTIAGDVTRHFTEAAIDMVYAASGGIPRVINLVCDRALSRANYADTVIDAEDLLGAIQDLQLPVVATLNQLSRDRPETSQETLDGVAIEAPPQREHRDPPTERPVSLGAANPTAGRPAGAAAAAPRSSFTILRTHVRGTPAPQLMSSDEEWLEPSPEFVTGTASASAATRSGRGPPRITSSAPPASDPKKECRGRSPASHRRAPAPHRIVDAGVSSRRVWILGVSRFTAEAGCRGRSGPAIRVRQTSRVRVAGRGRVDDGRETAGRGPEPGAWTIPSGIFRASNGHLPDSRKCRADGRGVPERRLSRLQRPRHASQREDRHRRFSRTVYRTGGGRARSPERRPQSRIRRRSSGSSWPHAQAAVVARIHSSSPRRGIL